MAQNSASVWHTVGVAADAAGVARRSAFRWVARGAIPYQQIGPRRYVEVGCLARFAANRGHRAFLAQGQATSVPRTPIPPSPADDDTLAAVAETAACAQELAGALITRVERLERLLGVPLDAP